MCNGFSSAQFNPLGQALGDKYRYADPLMAGLERAESRVTAPPQLPKPPAPLQEAKAPETAMLRQRRMARSPTMLTGPDGVPGVSLFTGAPTLLGG